MIWTKELGWVSRRASRKVHCICGEKTYGLLILGNKPHWLHHFYGDYFDAEGQVKPDGTGEPWEEQMNIYEALEAFEKGLTD